MEKGKHDDGVDDISENTPIDFRFTPLATFALQPSYFEQRFAEVPWNLRRILGYPGQREPGAGVDKLEFELLYGLRCRVTAPSLRLAEIAARLGSLPGRQPRTLPWKADGLQGAVYQRYRALWQRLYQGLRSRLSILEPWNAERAGALLLKEGVEFELRPTAHLRFPALLAKPDDAPNVPAGAQDPNGLAGGIGWGFESVNIYNALWRNPKSVAGELSRPFFSALGGWGHQKASFDGGLTTVYSDTAMGRTSSISIERIGRVGVFWNRAKHVIIYERTVAPSRQFYLEQDPLRGVPALRKVREYVEILQPDRRFPEYGAAPVTRGFVNGLTFPETSRIINVNSRWGTDVGREGWKVPLWVRGAEPRDVYPKPQITFRVTADQPGADVHLPIDQPEKLCFFTSTNPGHDADPELWPSIEHVDFAYLGELAPPDPGFLNGDTGVPNSKPEVPVILGSGPFTFTLEPAGRAVNVVTERTEAIVGAALRNLTLMRGGVPRPGGDMLDAGRILNHALDGLTNPFEQFLAPLPNRAAALPPAVVTTEIDRLRDRLTSELTGAYADIKSALGAGGVEDKICAAVVSRVKAQFVILERQVFEILDRLRSDLLARLRIIAPDTLTNPEWDAVKDPVKAAIEDAFTRVRTLVKVVHGTTGEFTARIDDGILRANDIAASVQSDIQRAREVVETQWNVGNPLPVQGEITKLRVVAEHALAALDFATAEVARHYTGGASDMIRTRVSTAVKDAEAAARKAQLLVRDLQAVTEGDVVVQLDALVTTVETIRKMVEDGLKQWKNSATQVGGATTELDELLGHLRDALEAAVVASPSPSEFFRRYVAEAQSFLDAQSTRLRKAIDDVETKIADHAKALCSVVFATRDELHAALDAILNPQRLHALLEDLGGLAPTAEELRREVGALQDGMTGRLREYLDRARATVNPDGTVGVLTDNTLRLFRAFGAAPHVPNLDFEIPKLELPAWGIDGVDGVLRDVGYYFAPERATVLITPLLAKANELKDVLNPASLKVPSKELLDRIIPVALEKFDLSTVFPHFAGLDLGNLFSNLKLPEIATDKVQVTHGIDPQSQRGWLEINVDVPYGVKPATVFAFAGVTMRLLRARFQAVSRVEAAVGEAPRHTFRGSIRGDWDIQVGGFPVAVIVDTALRFDDGGHLRFEVSPDRVKLQSVLAFLSELVAKFGFSEKGFTVRVLPTGIQSVLDLPLPDVQAGAFGLANLRLGFTFELRVLPEFRLGAHLAVSSRYRPFTMTIFILGGAGWVDVAVLYTPSTLKIETEVSIGITAAASLAIALGPIRGGVYAYFGITVDFQSSTTQGSNLTVGLLLLFRGEVCLLGFLSVSLSLALEAQYSPGGGLVGRGTVSYSIKICWCITINVSASVEYRFGNSGGNARLELTRAERMSMADGAGDVYDLFSGEYVEMFE